MKNEQILVENDLLQIDDLVEFINFDFVFQKMLDYQIIPPVANS